MKKIISLIVVLSMLVSVLGAMPLAVAAATSGTCGDAVTWNLDDEGTLTISGTGAMTDFKSYSAPWYSSQSSIKKVVVEDGVTTIGSYAFYFCTAVTEVSLPKSVTTIGYEAFRNCTSLTEITIPEGVTKIDSYAFYNCSALNTVSMPKSLVSVGSYAFYGSRNIKTVNIADIGAWCAISFPYESNPTHYAKKFYVNGELVTDLVIPEGVTSIGNYAFYNCENLLSVTVPSTVTSIGTNVFSQCSKLNTISLPEGLTSIGNSAFSYCRALKSVTLPESLTTLSASAFENCNGLAKINIPGKLTSLESYVFSNCALTEVELPNSLVNIGNGAFRYSLITTIEIPEGVTTIGDDAFYGSDLQSVTISGTVTSIGEDAFRSTDIAEITLPDSVTSVGRYAFYNCSSLTSITLSYKLTSIGDYAFSANEGTTIYGYTYSAAENYATANSIAFVSVGITPRETVASGECGDAITWSLDSYGLMTITGEGEMYDSYNAPWSDYTSIIKTVEITGDITNIGDYAFRGCNNITEVTIPDTVTEIGSYAFSGCSMLEGITLPANLTKIGSDAFSECESLAAIVIPDSVTSLGSSAFDGCSKLASITLPAKLTSIQYGTFYNCDSITEITIPDGVQYISNYAFESCDSLTSVNIPASVEYIEYGAFANCSSITDVNITDIAAWCQIEFGSYEANPTYYARKLYLNGELVTELDIPKGVTKIGDYAFSSCYDIKKAIVPYTVATIGEEAFPWVDSFEIHGYNNTAAQTYAENYSMTFVSLGELPLETVAEGTCGENLTWSLDTYGNLTISGTGSMESYSYYTSAPWYSYRNAIKNVTVEVGVTSVGSYAFYNCYNIQTATILYTVTSIGNYAFEGAPDDMVIKGHTPSAAEDYANDNYFTFESLGEAPLVVIAEGSCGDAVTWELDNRGKLTISGSGNMNNYAYSSHADWYSYKDTIKTIVIEDGVTSIGEYIFMGINNATSVTIPDSVRSIGKYAFRECYSLGEITIPAGVTSIGSSAFYNCGTQSEAGFVIKGYSPSAAEDYANNNYMTFESLGKAPVIVVASGTCGENLTWELDNYGLLEISGTGEMSLEGSAPWYSHRNSIKTVQISEGVTSIGDYAFQSYSYLEEAVLPESLVSIGYYAFAYCQSLNNVNIHYNVIDIDNTAFTGTYDVVITGYTGSVAEEYATHYSKEFVSIGEAPVVDVAAGDVTDTITWSLNNRGLLTVTGTGDMPEYDYSGPRPWDEYRDKVKTVEINGVDTVTQYSIMQCDDLTSVVLNDVKTVESYAFYYCNSLTEVTIPQSVDTMGSNAFGYSSFTIKGIENSYAEMYANYTGRTFEALEGELEIKTVYVSTVDELVAAIGSNTEIIMEDGIYLLDKTAVLGNVEYTWEYADTLRIENVINLTIKARNPGMVEIIASQTSDVYNYSYENAPLYIRGAYNLVFEGIRIGNMRMNDNIGREPEGDDTELMGGYEEGALDGYYGSYIASAGSNGVGIPVQNKVSFIDCDIFNCTYAISFSGGSLTVDNCTIRDNVKGAIAGYGDEIVVKDSVFSRNGNSTNYEGTYCLDMSGTVTNCTFINNGNENYASGSLTENGNVFSNNTWNGEAMKAYGVTKNGITWQVSDDSGEAVLKLGYTVNADNIAIESKAGTVYPYSVNSLPWAEYEIYSTDVNAGVVYDELIWGGIGKDATWQYEPDTKTLTISGDGEMSDIGYIETWYNSDIENIIIEDTITGVYNLFAGTEYYNDENNRENGVLYIGDVLVDVKYDVAGDVKVKDGTRVIADEAFYGCDKITSIVLPETVTNIGVSEKLQNGQSAQNGVFEGCASLTSITIPVSVTAFDHAMVYRCVALGDIYYSGTKAQWNEISTGKNNEQLDYCIIHAADGDITPPEYSYEITENGVIITGVNPTITSVTIPAEVEGLPVVEIESDVFIGNRSITSVVIEAAVDVAPYFVGCEKLESIVLPDSVTDIYDSFAGCYALENITLGDNVTYMYAYIFDDTAYYKNPANWDGGILYVDGYAVALSEDAPEKITLRNNVRGTSYGLFNNNSTVKEIVVPDGAKLIADGEFLYNMSALVSITLPDTFKAGGYDDFGVYQCEKLTNVNISANNPNYVSVDGVVFTKDKTQLVYMPMGRTGSYTISDGVTTIKPGAFLDTHLSSVTIPASVTNIEYSAFPYSYYLSDVYYNITVEEWENLENIYIGGSNMAFNNANLHLLDYDFVQEMLEYELSDDGTYYSVVGVKSYATEITIPAEYNNLPVRDIVPYALYDAKSLECINVEENNLVYTSVDGVLFTKDMTTVVGYPVAKAGEEYNLPETVRVIGNSAFRNNKNLKTVNLNSALENIGTYTFESSNIESIKITENVTTIGYSVFYGCKKLEKVYMGTNVRTIENWAFDDSLKYIYFDGSQNDWYSISGNGYVPSETTIVFAKIDIQGSAIRVEEEVIVIEMSYAPTTEDEKVFVVGCGESGESLTFTQADAYVGVLEDDKEVLDEVKYVKIFVWESLESMRPVGEPVLIPIE